MRLAVVGAVCLLFTTAFVGRAAAKGARAASRLLLVTAALAVLASPTRAAEVETRAFLAIDAAMREALAKDATRRFVYFSETLDAQRFDLEQYEPELLSMLAKKYSGLRIDVVVAITRPALDFVIEHGKLAITVVLSDARKKSVELAIAIVPAGTSLPAVGQELSILLARRVNSRLFCIACGSRDLFDLDQSAQHETSNLASSPPGKRGGSRKANAKGYAKNGKLFHPRLPRTRDRHDGFERRCVWGLM
jgi:hypothetical protein